MVIFMAIPCTVSGSESPVIPLSCGACMNKITSLMWFFYKSQHLHFVCIFIMDVTAKQGHGFISRMCYAHHLFYMRSLCDLVVLVARMWSVTV